MDVHAAITGDGGSGREMIMYILWGGMLTQSGEGKVTYEGGSRKCEGRNVGGGINRNGEGGYRG